MQPIKILHPAAVSIRILCTLFVLIFLTGFVQLLTNAIYQEFIRTSPRTAAESAKNELTEQEKQQQDIADFEKEFGLDGTLYLVNYTDAPGVSNERNVVVKDKDNTILFAGKEKDNPYAFIAWRSDTRGQYPYRQSVNQDYLNELNMITMEFSRSYTIPIVNAGNKRVGHWFFDTRKRYFTYYAIEGQCDGFLGANGYTQDARDVESFADCVSMDSWIVPNSYNPMLLYRTQYAVYQIDFQKKQVETLVKTKQDPIGTMDMNNWQERDTVSRPMLKVITKSEKLFLFFKNPQQAIEIQLKEDFRYGYLQFATAGDKMWCRLRETIERPKTDDRTVIRAWWDANRNKPIQFLDRLFELDENKNFVEKNSFAWTRPAYKLEVDPYSQADGCRRLINSFSTRVPRWIVYNVQKILGDKVSSRSTFNRFVVWFASETSIFNQTVNISLMTIFAAVTLLHGWPRRTSVIKLTFWIGFVFLFNLAGFLTYLALNHTPVVQCASCGKRRSLEQDACCRCGAELPLPKSKETDLVTTLSS